MKTRIYVGKRDIAKGERHTAGSCPIALAAERVTGRFCMVGSSTVDISGLAYDIPLPDEARAFISLFDGGHSVRPFTFTLDIPV